MESLKAQVVRLFLKFASRFVDLSKAQLATLGGQGLEAKIWQEIGVPSDHGWLIERNRERSGKLINSHRYRTLNQLGTLDKIVAGLGEDRSCVDAFHLDLCGTFCNKVIADFASALPLILKSKGRCLAITVADARRNLALERWPEFQERGFRLFGAESEDIFYGLLNGQCQIPTNPNAPAFFKPFDPTKATKREFGLLVELAELLWQQGFPWTPVVIKRYVYVSRFQGRPFRMRTYFFHFEHKWSKTPEKDLSEVWIESPLFFGNKDNFQEVELPAKKPKVAEKIQKKGETQQMSTSRLGEIARVLGGAEEAQYLELIAKSQQLDAILAALKAAPGVSVENQYSSSIQADEPSLLPTTRRGRRVRKSWETLSDREQIEWQIKALELKASHNGHWENGQWKKLLKEDFGHYNEDLGRSLRAALARTSGKFRTMFEDRIHKVFGDEAKPLLDRLSKIQ